jgi:hypothetical protein
LNAAPQFTLKVDRSNFDSVFREYQKWSKRQPSETVNAKLFFISRQSVNFTRKASPEAIRQAMAAPSKYYEGLTTAEALALVQRRKTKKGLPKNRETLKRNLPIWAARVLGNKINRIGFLASGWLPAIRKLDRLSKQGDITFIRRFAPKILGRVKQYGKEKGGVFPARLHAALASGTIWNDVGNAAAQASPRVKQFKQEGLDAGVESEIESMIVYIKRKWGEQFDRMKRQSKGVI